MANTPRLRIPLLSSGQAQKEVTHNEALQQLDAATQATCLGAQSNSPPNAPLIGACYLCGGAPTGEWAGQPNALAMWTASGWRFVTPFDGFEVTDATTGLKWRYLAGQWARGLLLGSELRVAGERVVGARAQAIANPTGGTVIDNEGRAAISAILTALQGHGLIST